MTLYINTATAEPHLVRKAISSMSHTDLEFLAMCIEFVRSGGKIGSQKKVTGKVLFDAIHVSASMLRKNQEITTIELQKILEDNK